MESNLQRFLDNYSVVQHSIDQVISNAYLFIDLVSGGSGGPYITGWILALFPYLSEDKENSYIWKDGGSWKDAMKVHSNLFYFSGI